MRAIVVAIAGALAIVAMGCGESGDKYVSANDALIRELPVFPGSEVLRKGNAPVRGPEKEAVATYIDYAVPNNVTGDDIIRYYEGALPESDWIHCRFSGPGTTPAPYTPSPGFLHSYAAFQRGSEVVYISLLEWIDEPATTYEVIVNEGSLAFACPGPTNATGWRSSKPLQAAFLTDWRVPVASA